MKGLTLLSSLAVLCGLPVFAQQAPGPVAQVVWVKIKPGMTNQWLEARKKHTEFHRKQNDSWTWTVSEIMTGERSGQFVVSSTGHHWKDFDGRDKFNDLDEADYQATLAPYEESTVSTMYVVNPEVSKPPATPNPSPFVHLLHFHLNMDGMSEFGHLQKKIHEAIQKTKWESTYIWVTLASGGEHPSMILVLPISGYAAMAPPAVSFDSMLEKAYGRVEAAAIMAGLAKSVRSQRSELVRYRADLSYIPASAAR